MPPSASNQTAPKDRVPAREKLALGLGQAAAMGTHNALTTLANPVYNVMMGISPAYLSVLTFIQRFWDAFLDPFVGQFSDKLRTRWGRRRPLVMLAGLPMALAFASLWFFPRNLGEFALVGYLLATSLVFYFLHSFVYIPVAALQAEATSDYHERTRVASVVGVCTWGFSLGNQWLYPLLQSHAFSDPIIGVRWVTAGAALLYGVMALAPALVMQERPAPEKLPTAKRESVYRGFRTTWSNFDFVCLLIIRGVSQFGYATVGVLGFYLNVYLVHEGDLHKASAIQGWLGTSYVLSSILAFWGFRLLSNRVGKQIALQIAAAFLVLGALAKILVYSPGNTWLQLIVPATNGIALSGISLLTTAMLADIVSADELTTRQRREGLFCAVLSWLDKVGSSSGALLSGFVLVWIGFNVKKGGAQSPETLLMMKWLYAAFPLIGAAATIYFARRYSLTEKRSYEIKHALESRALAQSGAAVSERVVSL